MKTIIKSTISGLAAMGMLASSASAACTNDAWNKVMSRGKIVVGVKADYKPWGYRNTDGDIVGMEIDMANDVAAKMGVDIELVAVQSSNRMQFLLDSVEALRTGLAELGVELLVRVGEPESVLPELVEQLGANRLHFVEEPGPEERAVEQAVLTRLGDRARSLPVETLLELDDPREFSRGLQEVDQVTKMVVPRRGIHNARWLCLDVVFR